MALSPQEPKQTSRITFNQGSEMTIGMFPGLGKRWCVPHKLRLE
jgi:hypothetical protein